MIDILSPELKKYASPRQCDYIDAVFPYISLLTTGEVADAVQTEDGSLLAYIAQRTPADFSSMQWYGARLTGLLGYHRIGMLYEEWSDHLLDQAEFEDFNPLPE